MSSTTNPLPAGPMQSVFLADGEETGDVTHDFENRTARRAGALNVFIPGGFESNMPAIVEWYRAQASARPAILI